MDEEFILELAQMEKFRHGITLFNSGEYFRAHEAWEEIWLRVSGRNKLFLQGLIQLAAAFHHLSRNNLAGAASLLKASLDKLEGFPANHGGINLVDLRKASAKIVSAAATIGNRPHFSAPQIEFNEETAYAKATNKPQIPAMDPRSKGPSSPYVRSRKKRST
jgi:predicted metal-dependent hydrolase